MIESPAAVQQEKASKESRLLKQRLEVLEKENVALKKSLYELSTRFNLVAHKTAPFSLDSLEVFDAGFQQAHITGAAAGMVGAEKGGGSDDQDFGTVSRDAHKDGRSFHLKHELKGHRGAVYAVQFSPCGKFLASGSFDKTVRIWDALSTQKEVHCLKSHSLNISDLSWSKNSAELLSGGYDQTCKAWDVESGKLVGSYASEGFVQCVMFSPQDANIFFSGTSRNALCMVDRRQPDTALTLENEAMVNSLYVYRDATYVLSADAAGQLKTWDVRTGKCVNAVANEPTKKPISHVTVSYNDGDEEPRYMAVNSYDNVMRVYDRGFSPPASPERLVHALKGYKNKNWPIKSSFNRFRDGKAGLKRGSSQEDMYGKGDMAGVAQGDGISAEKERFSEPTQLLATGSADPFVYVYNVGGVEGSSDLLQRLEGHTDRVYAVHFHPSEPILASCSADFTLKVWYSNGKKKKP
ncbi:WD40-repeat-containing domain protein [Powellomyces hirtus]|nr:WD40-repeat-containing domain protein [Powellomyces hirtus]